MALRELRQAKGLTMKQLAALSDVHYMKIHQIEVQKIKPENMSLKTALKLSNALGCHPAELIPDRPVEESTDSTTEEAAPEAQN